MVINKGYVFYSDARHGWLAVPIEDLKTLKIESQISIYSFKRGERAYLEEDADATLFLNSAASQGWNVTIKDVDEGNSSEIRNYARFKGPLE